MKTGMAGGIWSSGYLWSKTPGRLSSPWPPERLHGPPGALRFPLRLPSGLFSTTAVPRNSFPGSEEEDPTPVLGPRDPPESRSLAAAPALPPSLSRAPFHHCLFGFSPTGLRADACTCHTLSGHRDFAGAASGRLCSFSFALVAVTWPSAISSKVTSFLFIPF